MQFINMSRRDLLKCGALALGIEVMSKPVLGQGRGRGGSAAADGPLIRLVLEKAGSRPYWTPVGLYVQTGQKVRWRAAGVTATVTAFHPANDNHELRIPEGAKPFDSGPIQGEFEWIFEVEGTYDYFCRGLESIGTVGRIVVGNPGGPAEKPLGYGGPEGRAPVFQAQVKVLALAPSSEIVTKKVIPFQTDVIYQPYPSLAPRE